MLYIYTKTIKDMLMWALPLGEKLRPAGTVAPAGAPTGWRRGGSWNVPDDHTPPRSQRTSTTAGRSSGAAPGCRSARRREPANTYTWKLDSGAKVTLTAGDAGARASSPPGWAWGSRTRVSSSRAGGDPPQ